MGLEQISWVWLKVDGLDLESEIAHKRLGWA